MIFPGYGGVKEEDKMTYGITPKDIARMDKKEKLRSKRDRLLVGWSEVADELRCSVEEAQGWAEAWKFPLFYRPAQMEADPAKRTPCIFRDTLIVHLTGHDKAQQAESPLVGKIVRTLFSLGSEAIKGKLSIARIAEKINAGLEGESRIGPRAIGRELARLGIPRKKSMGRMQILWNPQAIRKLFVRYGLVSDRKPSGGED